METTNLKNVFLLGASIEILHQESKEWLDTIEFWKDETKFFEDLLNKKHPKEEDKEIHNQLIKTLNTVSLDLLETLELDVIEHEKRLAKLFKEDKGVSDWAFREDHKNLKNRVNKVHEDFKTFKNLIFSYVKNL